MPRDHEDLPPSGLPRGERPEDWEEPPPWEPEEEGAGEPPLIATVGDLWDRFADEMRRRAGGGYRLVSTGIGGLDRLLGGGYHPGQICGIHGPTGCGKTSFVAETLTRQALDGHPAVIWNLELSFEVLCARLVCQRTGAPWIKVLTGGCLDDVRRAGEELRAAPFVYVGPTTPQRFADTVRATADSYGESPTVAVDFGQLAAEQDPHHDSREANNRTVTLVRELTKETDATMLLLSSVSRANYKINFVKGEPDKGAVLAAFKESGSWEYACGAAIGLVRPQGEQEPGRDKPMWACLAKNRLVGVEGSVAVMFDGQAGTFSELDRNEMPGVTGSMSDPELKLAILKVVREHQPDITSKEKITNLITCNIKRTRDMVTQMLADKDLYQARKRAPITTERPQI